MTQGSKMKKLAIFLFIPVILLSQPLPVNFKGAYEKQTRSYDGKPGRNYWQNKSDYIIKAEVIPSEKRINAEETVTYYNNSPDTLDIIVVKLLGDLYRKGNARDIEISPDAVNEGMKISTAKLNGSEFEITRDNEKPHITGTKLIIPLKEKLLPGEKAELYFKWEVKIPGESQIRMGAYDSTSFFVAYWFPQIAVYDDIDGWDMNDYTGHAETYNDFGNYQVDITVPQNFVVWASGKLSNPEEVFEEKILDKYITANSSDEIIHIISEEDLGNVTKKRNKITYKFRSESIPDFAFAMSDHYLWDASTWRDVLISAAYNPESKGFYNVAEVARKSIVYFSEEMPGVKYPYPVMTVFNGRGGMEFPMMCNDSSVDNLRGTVHLTSHEISHTYFPFYMGINERKYAWMDEGWATMLPFDFQELNAPGYDPRQRNAEGYSQYGGRDTDLPPIVPSSQLRGISYRMASYSRPGAAYDFMMKFMGKEKFKACLHEYIKRWNGKHPTPYDFFNTFEDVSGEDLDWFFKPWFFEFKYPDLSIKKAEAKDGYLFVEIENNGGLPLPVVLFVKNGEAKEKIFEAQADIWKGKPGELKLEIKCKKPEELLLGTPQIPDVDDTDNKFSLK
ncbi:peptidase [Melioribacter roseus P3M-2]|uniref:Peptidase n=2 Tax=Melioribacteraceae TaxID=1334117 RepID=I6YUP1_MELRP|nr:peptidase [Melioribacter roseus P3M-2]